MDSSYKIRYLATHDEFMLEMTEGGHTYIFHRNESADTYVCGLDSDVADSKYINFKERVTLVTTVAQNKQKKMKAAAIARTYQNNLGCYHQARLYTQVLQKCFFKNGSRHLYGLVWWF